MTCIKCDKSLGKWCRYDLCQECRKVKCMHCGRLMAPNGAISKLYCWDCRSAKKQINQLDDFVRG